MLKRIVTATTVVSVFMLVVLFFSTNPASAGPLGILAFFVFTYLIALGVLTFLFRGGSVLATKIIPKRHGVPRVKEMAFLKAYYYSSVIALVPAMLIAIQSVGEVGIYQVLLILFFVLIAWVYVSNRVN